MTAIRRGGRTRIASGLLGMGLVCVPATGLAQFSVSPVIATVERGETGDRSIGLISIRNESGDALEFRLSTSDFDQPTEGGHSYLPTGAHPGGCGADARVVPEALSVPAGQTGQVRFEVPGGPRDRSCWFMVFIESPTALESGVMINQRVGVKVFGVGPSATVEGEFHAGSLVQSDSARSVVLEFANPGTAPTWPRGSVEVRNFRGTVVAASRVSPFTVLPESSRKLNVDLPSDLEPGRYLAVAMLDYGGEILAGTQIPFSVP